MSAMCWIDPGSARIGPINTVNKYTSIINININIYVEIQIPIYIYQYRYKVIQIHLQIQRCWKLAGPTDPSRLTILPQTHLHCQSRPYYTPCNAPYNNGVQSFVQLCALWTNSTELPWRERGRKLDLEGSLGRRVEFSKTSEGLYSAKHLNN